MNWTGGSLQRMKHANKGVTQKQKAYFVRARTHLQNGSKSPVVPFRPSYLQNDDNFELAGHLPSFGSGSIRHTGHSTRHRRDVNHREYSPEDKHQMLGHHHRARSRHVVSNRAPDKRKSVDAGIETQLLQANRKRLLEQRDWIGVAPSRPVELPLPASEGRNRIGKRRRVRGTRGAAARRNEHAPVHKMRLHDANDHSAGASALCGPQYQANGIRIRIGTDALTTACSIQAEDHTPSHASSESMLFDQQNHDVDSLNEPDAAWHSPYHTCSSASTIYHVCEIYTQVGERSVSQLSSFGYYETHRARHGCASCGPGDEATASVLRDNSRDDTRGPSGKGVTPSPRITQRVEGTEQPFRLVFESSKSSKLSHLHNALRRVRKLATEEPPETANADAHQKGLMHPGSKAVLPTGSEAMTAAAIVDEKPWKSFLDIPDISSSHTTDSDNAGKSAMHYHPTARNPEAEGTSWSRHATEGNQTHLSSSVISASLPASMCDAQSEHQAPAHGLKTDLDRCNDTTFQVVDEDERMWQNFIFGSDEETSSDTVQQHKDNEERHQTGSSEFLPLSGVVVPVSSTPFRTMSDRASREGIHDNASLVPAAGSWAISTRGAMSGYRLVELSDEDEDEEQVEHGVFGGDLVVDASMLNIASHDSASMSSRMFSLAETSRSGLDPSQCATDKISQQAQASSSNEASRYFRQFSISDSHSSDSGKLDLIDPDASL
ncbi:hypothetical protein EK21DRAFT_90328 [Setomelanomma holmii]|uniref:Uncharacterized protein n=1 Tax=Setomelanomma holmii TaxID=210430 RepID=A0A9P4H7V4_9PLEO|nr:hypothetical protein EK21DRAFT_90328 [Setomelanomma holmii]